MKKKQVRHSKELDGLILTRSLTKKEQEKAADDLAIARKKIQSTINEETRLAARVLQFKLKIKEYLRQDQFDPQMTFSSCLGEYVNLQDKRHKVFAQEIDIKETELSLFINRHRIPPEYIIIRLEIHSNNAIPANWWYKLIEKEREHLIATNRELRREQKKYVHKKLDVKV